VQRPAVADAARDLGADARAHGVDVDDLVPVPYAEVDVGVRGLVQVVEEGEGGLPQLQAARGEGGEL